MIPQEKYLAFKPKFVIFNGEGQSGDAVSKPKEITLRKRKQLHSLSEQAIIETNKIFSIISHVFRHCKLTLMQSSTRL